MDKPKDKQIISCKWLFKMKPGIEGVDYQEVFSPVVKHVSIRMLLSVVVNLNPELEQMDVKTMFLHGNLEEDIYMYQPEGY